MDVGVFEEEIGTSGSVPIQVKRHLKPTLLELMEQSDHKSFMRQRNLEQEKQSIDHNFQNESLLLEIENDIVQEKEKEWFLRQRSINDEVKCENLDHLLEIEQEVLFERLSEIGMFLVLANDTFSFLLHAYNYMRGSARPSVYGHL